MNILKKLFSKEQPSIEQKPVHVEPPINHKKASNEPYVEVIKLSIPNPKDPTTGYFELDWNAAFIQSLRDAGYSGREEEEVVDQWFNELCRGVASDEDY